MAAALPSSSPSPSGAKEWEVSYSLPEPFDCEELEDSSSVVFRTESDKQTKPHKITGFTVTVTAQNEEEMLELANTQAERLAQIMSVKAQGHVKYAYEGCNPKNPQASGGTKKVCRGFIGRYNIRPMIDELNLNSNQKISSIMQNNEDTNMQLYHARLALEAEENRQFANMYRELFQVIEKNTGLQDYKKYKSLRNAISHQKPVEDAEKDVKKHFPPRWYEFTTNHEFDHNSKKNKANLKIDAGDLKGIVMPHLIGKLR